MKTGRKEFWRSALFKKKTDLHFGFGSFTLPFDQLVRIKKRECTNCQSWDEVKAEVN